MYPRPIGNFPCRDVRFTETVSTIRNAPKLSQKVKSVCNLPLMLKEVSMNFDRRVSDFFRPNSAPFGDEMSNII